MDSIASEISRLRDDLNRHNHKYYVENSPEISDREFDEMMKCYQKNNGRKSHLSFSFHLHHFKKRLF